MAFKKQAVLFLASFNYFVTEHFKVYFYLLVYFLAYPFQNMELFPFSYFFFLVSNEYFFNSAAQKNKSELQ